jgi:2-polyprenyl-6-methoxyphenol hydroxylase-like FAD-dependent oxidoreductase
MPNVSIDVDVLVVGAGPVGLFLANECARRGLRFRIIEARSSQSIHSKALAIFPRTLEIFDMAGVVEPFLAAANRVTSVAMIAAQRRLATIPFAPTETPYSFVAMVPQDVTEKLLVEELVRRGGVVEYNMAFVSAEQQDGQVRVLLDHNGERNELLASFVVGCDGAHSAVRHGLGLKFEGAEYRETFLLADVETNTAVRADQMQLCPNASGPLAVFPMSATRRRIVATIGRAEGDAPSLELVKKILGERGPERLEARELRWSSYFHIHHRNVGNLRFGRIFLAGDAAHIHSPFGGQGMNTGLQDVWNLAWKLDLFVRGYGNEPLLDSYSAERIPVIKRVIALTDFLTKVMGTASRFAQALRNFMLPKVSRLAPFQRRFVQTLSELGIAYRGSPIVNGAGERYFDDSLRGGDGISRRYLLMIDAATQSSIEAPLEQFCRSFGSVVELRQSRSPGITLVRPDGYVAYSSRSGGNLADLEAVRLLLERQTIPGAGALEPEVVVGRAPSPAPDPWPGSSKPM